MQKQILKINASLKKVAEGIERTINGEFKNNEMIFKLLIKREHILSKTQKKLIKLNKTNLITWEDSQNTIIY